MPPRTRDDEPSRATTVAENTATWFVHNGVIHVESLTDPNGTTPLHGTPLGACFGTLPRALWDRIRFDYEKARTR